MRARYQHQQTGITWDGKTFKVDHNYEHSAPLTEFARTVRYFDQTGRNTLTVRQERSLRKAHRRAVARASALLAQS